MGRPRKHPDSDVMIAKTSAVITLDGNEVVIVEGVTRAHRGHEIVQKWPGFWKPIDVHYGVEQMTAAPGEQRGT